MKTPTPAARHALRLGLVLGAFGALAAFAQLADANVSDSTALHARLKPLAKGLNGDWTDAGLARALGVAPAALAAATPGATGTVDFAPNPLLFGDRPELRLPDLSVDKAKLINEGVPFATAPIVAAKPFVLTGPADDKTKALTCLTQAVYYEAGFEPIEGERAVAQVVLNRMRHPIFPHTVCGVVYQGSSQSTGCQFSFTCDGALHRGTPGAVAWDRARAVASAALNGYVQPAVGLATHYHTDYVAPYWMTTVTKLARVGQHIFYRWPGALGLPAAFGARYAAAEHIPSVTQLMLAAQTKGRPGVVTFKPGQGVTLGADGAIYVAQADDAPSDGRVHTRILNGDASTDAEGATPQARRAAVLAGHAAAPPGGLETLAPEPATTPAAPAGES